MIGFFKGLLLIVAATFLLFLPAHTKAFSLFGNACKGAAANSSTCHEGLNGKGENPVAGPNGLVQRAVNLIAVIAGIGAVIVIIIGGLNFVTSGGDPEKTKNARAMITNALIGLVLLALAYTIISFVIQKVIS